MSMSNRMHDRLRKLYRLVLVHMRNIEAAIALPPSSRKAVSMLSPYRDHRMEALEPRVLLSSSSPVSDLSQLDGDSGQAPIVVEYNQSELGATGDEVITANSNVALDDEIMGTLLVSGDVNGISGNGESGSGVISDDGRFVAFSSLANNLVADDLNNARDVFVYDRQTGQIELISKGADNVQANADSGRPAISSDGRYVVYTSNATNLVADDTNGVGDVFIYDRQMDTTERVSVSSGGVEGNNSSGAASVSADGQYVSFSSLATNLVAGDTNDFVDNFVYDRQADVIQRVSVDSFGAQANGLSGYSVISADGRYVSFDSDASNLVVGDTNNATDVFVFDLQTSVIERVSLDGIGMEGNGESYNTSISADGRFVSFQSDATNLVADDTNNATDVFVYDRQTGAIERVSVNIDGIEGNGDSDTAAISANGQFVIFESNSTNLVPDDTNGVWDVFVYDRLTSDIQLVSVAADGSRHNDGDSGEASISGDGQYVTFTSLATNLVADDDNDDFDVFIVDREVVVVDEPEVEVQGNDQEILDGDTIPSVNDDTSFGTVTVGDVVSRTYTVYNTGTGTLFTSDLSVPAGFTITEGLSDTIESDQSDTFTVTMDTATAGIKSGQVSFTTNDNDEETYSFVIAGTVNESDEVDLPNLAVTLDDSRIVSAIVAGTATRITLPVTVVNNGDVALPASSFIAIEVYARPVGGGDDILLTTLTNQNVSNLNVNASKRFNVIFTLPAEIATDSYVLVANVDTQNVIVESNEGDNEGVGTRVIAIAEPFVNLTATLDERRIPAAIVAGTTTRIIMPITVFNEGNVALPANTRIDIQIYARPVDGDGEDDILLTTLTNQNVSNLRAGTSRRFNANFTLPAEIDTNSYVLVANIDSQNVVEESDENDNEAVGEEVVVIAEPFVNLTATLDERRIPAAIVAGTAARIIMPITVFNEGNVALAANTRIDIQIVARPVDGDGDDDILLTTLTDQNLSNLRAGTSRRINAIFTLPQEIDTNSYVLVAVIDSQDVVEESDEEDNEAVGMATVAIAEPFVNLSATLDDSRITTSIVSGTATRVRLPITILNEGNVALARNTRIDIQIYARPVDGGGEGEDILLTTLTNQNVSNLQAGAARRINAIFTLPAEIATDDYVLVAYVESQNIVEESDEDDNEAVGTSTIAIAEGYVNLIAYLNESRIPTSVVGGTSTRLFMPITLCNRGNIALAPRTMLAIEIFARPVGGGGDILLTTLTNLFASNLQPKTSTQYFAAFTLPADIAAGDYVLVANVDSQDVVNESNEGDNLAIGTTVIQITGDIGGF